MIFKTLKNISVFLVWLLIIELGSRVILHVKIKLPITAPQELLTEVIYPEVGYVECNYKFGKENFNILLLGGSVINPRWSDLEKTLGKNVQQHTSLNVNVYNLSMPGHNSLDNLIKYEALRDFNFDVVVYYESINETRVNNIDSAYFKNDYSHISWYRNIYLIKKHPELKFTVIPFFLEYIVDRINLKVNRNKYIFEQLTTLKNFDKVSPTNSAKTFRANLSRINKIAEQKKEQLLLCTYAYYVPANVTLTGSKEDKEYYSECKLSSPVTNWGSVNNTLKSLKLHNEVIHSVAKASTNVILYDFSKEIEVGRAYFCDICHMTSMSNRLLSKGISKTIVEQVLKKHI
jgi:hypothetical protein